MIILLDDRDLTLLPAPVRDRLAAHRNPEELKASRWTVDVPPELQEVIIDAINAKEKAR